MIIGGIILLVFGWGMGFIIALYSKERESVICGYLAGYLLAFIGTLIIWYATLAESPTALDVYRGRTVLKITSINGVPQDTVVVFKKGSEKK